MRLPTSLVVICVAGLIAVTAGETAFQAEQRYRYEVRREEWQKVPEIFAAMGVTSGSVVADIGAGGGFFTVRLAEAVGAEGRVYAVDISAREVERLRDRLAGALIVNVEVIQGELDDPRLPDEAIDAALIVNAYHEMREHEAMLRAIFRALKPGGRLVIEDQIALERREAARDIQVESHEVAPEIVAAELALAGFEIVEQQDPFTRASSDEPHWLLVARRPR